MSDHNERTRQQFKRFRILVIGRANAGKTTLLQRICKTTEAPIVRDHCGKEITLDLRGTQDRGEHDIEHEISFKSNDRFVFHDSRGFETGRADELCKVQSFIDKRAGFAKLLDRLHVIWYCIPMGDSRPFTAAEEAFFSECGTGQVPVIVIFTKFDALYTIAFGELWGQGNLGKSLQEAAAEAPQHANKMFQDDKYLDWLAATKFPPKNHVCLANMEREEADCTELIESTAAALDDEMLESLLVSAQCHNLEICISYAIKRTLRRYILEIEQSNKSQGTEENWEMQCKMAIWFPHILVELTTEREYPFLFLAPELLMFSDLQAPQAQSTLHSMFEISTHKERIVFVASSILLISEHSYYPWDSKVSGSHLITIFDQYVQSSYPAALFHALHQVLLTNDGNVDSLCTDIFRVILKHRLDFFKAVPHSSANNLAMLPPSPVNSDSNSYLSSFKGSPSKPICGFIQKFTRFFKRST